MAVWTQLFVLSVLSVSLVSAGPVDVDEAVLQQLLDSVQTLETRNEHLEEQVKALDSVHKRQATNNGPVGFTARMDVKEITGIHSPKKVIFGTTVTDLGTVYNNVTGIFTAPVSGIYMFTCSLLDGYPYANGYGVKVHGEIILNGTPLVRVFAHAEPTYRDQGSNTVFVNVQQGDQLWVQVVDNRDLSLGGEMYSTFSGYLLWRM